MIRSVTLTVFVSIALGVCAPAADVLTAYDAIRLLAQDRGETIYERVVDVEGRRGMSQPELWRVVVADPSTPGVLCEFEVRTAAAPRERARSGDLIDCPVMDLRRLNLNSDGAFQVANFEAYRRKVGFDRVDYRLRVLGPERRAQWTLELADHKGFRVAVLQLDAETGELLSWSGRGSDKPPADGPAPDDADGGGLIGRAQRSIEEAGTTLSHGAARMGEWLDRFFTGEGALDRGPRRSGQRPDAEAP